MEHADLYFNEININRYFSETECRKCGSVSCKDLVKNLYNGKIDESIMDVLPHDKAAKLRTICKFEQIIPPVPKLELPRPGFTGMIELSNPQPGDTVLVTGNNQFTQDVLLAVLSTTTSPFYLLLADTQGDPLDMAVILNSFNAITVKEALEPDDIFRKTGRSILIIPGRAAHLQKEIKDASGRTVEIGPVCAAEFPLFFGDQWKTE